MKKIETLYAILNVENGDEQICGFENNRDTVGMMQAVSTNKELILAMLKTVEHSIPNKKFWMATFEIVSIQ